jgi:hypothetical protein
MLYLKDGRRFEMIPDGTFKQHLSKAERAAIRADVRNAARGLVGMECVGSMLRACSRNKLSRTEGGVLIVHDCLWVSHGSCPPAP